MKSQLLDDLQNIITKLNFVKMKGSLDLSGSAVGYAAVKTVLEKCIRLGNLNLSSCRGLPRGMKRNYSNSVEVAELRSAIEAGRFDEKPDTDNES